MSTLRFYQPLAAGGRRAQLGSFGRPARETQAQLQQLVPHIAARESLDHAVDAGRMHKCSLDLRGIEAAHIALDELLTRAPDARIAHRLLQRPATGKTG